MLAFLVVFPPFSIVPLEAANEHERVSDFDPVQFVDEFWEGPLASAVERALDAQELLTALKRDPAGAAKRLGRRLGLGGSTFYLISGTGSIKRTDDSVVRIAVEGSEDAGIAIELGPVFGNAIRDGSGLLDISAFKNGQQFNALSAELNRRVEERVLPSLARGREPGTALRFAGAVEIADPSEVPSVLHLIPVRLEFP